VVESVYCPGDGQAAKKTWSRDDSPVREIDALKSEILDGAENCRHSRHGLLVGVFEEIARDRRDSPRRWVVS